MDPYPISGHPMGRSNSGQRHDNRSMLVLLAELDRLRQENGNLRGLHRQMQQQQQHTQLGGAIPSYCGGAVEGRGPSAPGRGFADVPAVVGGNCAASAQKSWGGEGRAIRGSHEMNTSGLMAGEDRETGAERQCDFLDEKSRLRDRYPSVLNRHASSGRGPGQWRLGQYLEAGHAVAPASSAPGSSYRRGDGCDVSDILSMYTVSPSQMASDPSLSAVLSLSPRSYTAAGGLGVHQGSVLTRPNSSGASRVQSARNRVRVPPLSASSRSRETRGCVTERKERTTGGVVEGLDAEILQIEMQASAGERGHSSPPPPSHPSPLLPTQVGSSSRDQTDTVIPEGGYGRQVERNPIPFSGFAARGSTLSYEDPHSSSRAGSDRLPAASLAAGLPSSSSASASSSRSVSARGASLSFGHRGGGNRLQQTETHKAAMMKHQGAGGESVFASSDTAAEKEKGRSLHVPNAGGASSSVTVLRPKSGGGWREGVGMESGGTHTHAQSSVSGPQSAVRQSEGSRDSKSASLSFLPSDWQMRRGRSTTAESVAVSSSRYDLEAVREQPRGEGGGKRVENLSVGLTEEGYGLGASFCPSSSSSRPSCFRKEGGRGADEDVHLPSGIGSLKPSPSVGGVGREELDAAFLLPVQSQGGAAREKREERCEEVGESSESAWASFAVPFEGERLRPVSAGWGGKGGGGMCDARLKKREGGEEVKSLHRAQSCTAYTGLSGPSHYLEVPDDEAPIHAAHRVQIGNALSAWRREEEKDVNVKQHPRERERETGEVPSSWHAQICRWKGGSRSVSEFPPSVGVGGGGGGLSSVGDKREGRHEASSSSSGSLLPPSICQQHTRPSEEREKAGEESEHELSLDFPDELEGEGGTVEGRIVTYKRPRFVAATASKLPLAAENEAGRANGMARESEPRFGSSSSSCLNPPAAQSERSHKPGRTLSSSLPFSLDSVTKPLEAGLRSVMSVFDLFESEKQKKPPKRILRGRQADTPTLPGQPPSANTQPNGSCCARGDPAMKEDYRGDAPCRDRSSSRAVAARDVQTARGVSDVHKENKGLHSNSQDFPSGKGANGHPPSRQAPHSSQGVCLFASVPPSPDREIEREGPSNSSSASAASSSSARATAVGHCSTESGPAPGLVPAGVEGEGRIGQGASASSVARGFPVYVYRGYQQETPTEGTTQWQQQQLVRPRMQYGHQAVRTSVQGMNGHGWQG
uniref:Uncharacterized protein n=1 Tax=Chromera velia CCMP2878 TaxID=1169474 RepID=A0A0G4FB52_9ALVE|eukprot:Cvel_16094.t1-p1 / transcript=Cvel_16094.t1 / gene=Cvel_16094 / organism=Chromera_velia_CCMP2878 / gene_product=hypothetical protein / transcript_product=hypothetical protein / location=Cvel_scaffold1224:41298-46094(-) / protein_length=1209 / sequence_SO=supercontig / SO=protein_coding / is_pseudo=false